MVRERREMVETHRKEDCEGRNEGKNRGDKKINGWLYVLRAMVTFLSLFLCLPTYLIKCLQKINTLRLMDLSLYESTYLLYHVTIPTTVGTWG